MLEALISILIFSFGILGLIGIQANAVGLSIDAKYRADAAYLANQIVSQMWVDRANMDSYAHLPVGTPCDSATGTGATGSNSTNGNVYPSTTGSWTYQVSQSLPGASADKQQIKVTTPGGTATRLIEVTLCWKRPTDSQWHKHATTTQVYQ